MKDIKIYDTTLRDGAQSEDVNLNLTDKVKMALKLDELGVHYIEGGWPGASPLDTAFFTEIANYNLKNALVTAFGSTHHPAHLPEKDPNLHAIIVARPSVATIFGKSCEMHAKEALRIDPLRNLEVISASVAFLRQELGRVFFDAEHFFDGYIRNPEYALAALKAAHEAGAEALVLCDTNGGTTSEKISTIVKHVCQVFPESMIGIHAHNDCELAVANSIAAVQAGASQIQGSMNGIGERCGNANLCSIIPILELKFSDYQCLPKGHLELLRSVANYVSEVANLAPFNRQPFVGYSAFAHKGGVHVSAINRNSTLYEHINPELVGNRQRVLLTDLAGRSNIVALAKRYGFHLDKDQPVVKGMLAELKEKASLGYDYAAAEASVELLLLRKLARRGVREFFKLVQWRVLESKLDANAVPCSEATVTVEVEGITEHTAASGEGPVNALDNALRKALCGFYPSLSEMRLVDFKVRVLNSANASSTNSGASHDSCSPCYPGSSTSSVNTGTASLVRVLIESSDNESKWVTVGVSFNIIEASWQALVDSITYKLYKDENAVNLEASSSGKILD